MISEFNKEHGFISTVFLNYTNATLRLHKPLTVSCTVLYSYTRLDIYIFVRTWNAHSAVHPTEIRQAIRYKSYRPSHDFLAVVSLSPETGNPVPM